MENWHLNPGDRIPRIELHEAYGGRRQGGIAPSTKSPNVIIFSAPSGQQYGYFDGWHDDGLFHYTGEGQQGDQEMKQGNGALAKHQQDGKVVRVFAGARGEVTYVGPFKLTESEPQHYTTDAPDVNGEMRKVIVFRLEPIGDVQSALLPKSAEEFQPPTAAPDIQEVDPENHATERFLTLGSAERVAERREAALVQNYLTYRRHSGLPPLKRLKVKPAGETQPLYTDLFSPDEKLIIEAKGTVTREALRSAVGQLLDYRRFVTAPNRIAVLLPEEPRADLVAFLRTYGVEIIHSDGGIFKHARYTNAAEVEEAVG